VTKTFKEKTIKSFVRRTGRITKAQSAALKTIWPLFGVGFDKKKLDLIDSKILRSIDKEFNYIKKLKKPKFKDIKNLVYKK